MTITDCEIESMLGSGNIYQNKVINSVSDKHEIELVKRQLIGEKRTFWVVVVRHGPIAVECDANFAFLCWFEVFPVGFDGKSMCVDDAVRSATKGVERLDYNVHSKNFSLTSRARLRRRRSAIFRGHWNDPERTRLAHGQALHNTKVH